MATLIFIRNPLSQRDMETFDVAPGTTPLDWLLEHYPPERGGAGGPVLHWHDGERIDAQDDAYLERPIMAGERAVLMVPPAGIDPISIIITAVVVAVVSAAVNIGLSLLFPDPVAPVATQHDGPGSPSPAYNVRSRQNIARLGEPVPVQYGRVLMTPDLIAQPCATYDAPRGMHIDMIMCLGQGDYDIYDVIVGETSMNQIEGAGAQWIHVRPGSHNGEFGHLYQFTQDWGWTGNFFENPWVSAEVGEQRFTNAGDSAGFYQVGRAGVMVGQILQILIEWPRGLYQMPEWGEPTGTAVNWDIYVDEADANGNAVPGTRQEFLYSLTGGSMDPRRETYVINLGRSAAWLVKLYRRTEKEPNGEEQNEFYWRGLMLACGGPPDGRAYGNATLLLVRLHADQVSSSADRQVRVDCARRLPLIDGSGGLGATSNPAQAFADIYCNTEYGAGRPRAELDQVRLHALEGYWAGYGFNAVYTQRTTVWEALAQSMQVVAAAPLPIGGAMSVAQDGIRPVRSMLFTEQNMVRNSFSLAYHFEPTGAADGVEIAYVDPSTWSPAYARYPVGSVSPDRMNLFGCANHAHAAQYARLQWQRRQMLRRLVQFSTELEGLIPNPGERIAVAHTLPRWGVSGLVARVDGLALTLDRDLPWDEVPGPWYMMFRDEFSGASAIVQVMPGSAANQVALASSPWGPGQDWCLGPLQERTHYAWGDGERVVKDFTLTVLSPKGGKTVDVSGVVYDPEVYFDTLTFLQNPVP